MSKTSGGVSYAPEECFLDSALAYDFDILPDNQSAREEVYHVVLVPGDMSKRLLICVLLATGLIPPSVHAGEPSASEREDAEAIVLRFCGFLRGSRDLNDLIPLATPELIAIIRDAEARNQEIAVAHPGDKPPLGGGVPYTGNQDHAPLCNTKAQKS